MENYNNNNSTVNQAETTADNLINPRNAATNTEVYPNEKFNGQTNEDIAEQGYTVRVRDGHNPDQPNPFEPPLTNDQDDDVDTDRGLDEDEIDEEDEISEEDDWDEEEDIDEIDEENFDEINPDDDPRKF